MDFFFSLIVILLRVASLFFSTQAEEHFQNEPISRTLQTNRDVWLLEEPAKSFEKFKLTLDYELSDFIEDDMIEVKAFTNGGCSTEIDNRDLLRVNVFPDDTPKGDGSGTRGLQVRILIDPTEIVKTAIISYSEDQAIVTFCVGVNLVDPFRASREPMTTLETQIGLALVLTDNVGITKILDENRAVNWGAEVYQCNKTNHPIESPAPISQGQKSRICIRRNQATIDDGIYIAGMNDLTYSRDAILQTALTSGGKPSEGGLTEVKCETGSELCVLESVLRNEYFYSPGVVEGTGNILFQFGTSLEDEERRLGAPIRVRSMYSVGEAVARRPVKVSVQVEPSSETYVAEAFRCTIFNEMVQEDNLLYADDSARICFQPDKRAREAGVFMRRIDSFAFVRNELEQKVIEGGQVIDGNTLLVCTEGDMVCSLKTELQEGFFFLNGQVDGYGSATVQFGPENRQIASQDDGSRIRQLRIRIDTRALQGSDVTDSDPGYAGGSETTVNFGVVFSKKSRANPLNWWKAAPTYLRVLYILGLIVAILLLVCCCAGCCILRRRQKAFEGQQVADDRSKDSSMDAFIDSKASFYTDLDFDTDASDDSSEESMTEHLDDDLWHKVDILFPKNPDPEDLSQALGPEGDHVPVTPQRHNSLPPPPPEPMFPDRMAQSEQRPPHHIYAPPTQRMKRPSVGPSDDVTFVSNVSELTNPVNAVTGRPLRLSNVEKGRGRGGRDLSQSEHGGRVGGRGLPGRGGDLSQSEHGGRVGGRGLPGKHPHRHLQSDSLGGYSQHSQGGRYVNPKGCPPATGGRGNPLGYSQHSRGGRHADMLGGNSQHSLGADRHNVNQLGGYSQHSHGGQNPPRRGYGRGRAPGRGLSLSEHGPPRQNSGYSRSAPPGRGRGAGRGGNRGPPAGRVPIGRNGIVPGSHPSGLTQVPIAPTSMRGNGVGAIASLTTADDNLQAPQRMPSNDDLMKPAPPAKKKTTGSPKAKEKTGKKKKKKKTAGKAKSVKEEGDDDNKEGPETLEEEQEAPQTLSKNKKKEPKITPVKHAPKNPVTEAKTEKKHTPFKKERGGAGPLNKLFKHAPKKTRTNNNSTHSSVSKVSGSFPSEQAPPAATTNSQKQKEKHLPRNSLLADNNNNRKHTGSAVKRPPAKTANTSTNDGSKKPATTKKQKKKKTASIPLESAPTLSTPPPSESAPTRSKATPKKQKRAPTVTHSSTKTSATTVDIGNGSGSSREESSSSDSDLGLPNDYDICFEAEDHDGTEAFVDAIRATLDKFGPVAYTPKVYRRIKKQLPGRRFFICDDDANPHDWREVTKSELIDLVWNYYEVEKGKL